MSLEKAKCATPDLAEETRKMLLELIPECAGEAGEVDFDKLKQALSSEVIEGNVERYEFTWPGKRKARAAASAPTTKTLRPCRDESVDYDKTGNLYIEGDNLEVLKLLQTVYAGKVKMIYIDPPYNTGKDFIYRDRFALTDKELAERGEQQDDDGLWNIQHPEINEASAARYHSNWCSMMYPRLKLARNLLRDDGVMFISIDDNEVTNLRRLCDEVFGAINFVGSIIIETATDNNPSQISTEHEYMLCYARILDVQTPWTRRSSAAATIRDKYLELKARGLKVPMIQDELRKWIKAHRDELPQVTHYDNVDEKGVFHDGDIANTRMGGYQCRVLHPVTGKQCKIPAKGFRYPQSTLDKMVAEGDILFGEDETVLIKPKKRIENAKELLRSVIYEDGRASTKTLDNLLSRGVFENPKSVSILLRIIDFVTSKDSLVLDFFSGSATTAHAVMQLNAEDGGKRKFIMVQLPELCAADSEAEKAGYETICEIGKERIRRSGANIKEDAGVTGGDLDVGFRVLKLDSSSLREVKHTAGETDQELKNFSRIQDGRTAEDLLFQMLLETHIPLSEPIREEKVGRNKVFVVGVRAEDELAGAPLVACLEGDAKMTTEFFTEVAKLKPGRAFFRDDAFADDSARTNLQQVFTQFSPSTTVTVI